MSKRKVPFPQPADIVEVMFFLRGAVEQDLTLRGRKSRDAFDAFARMLGVDPECAWRAIE